VALYLVLAGKKEVKKAYIPIADIRQDYFI
jgi:hypothetical protein